MAIVDHLDRGGETPTTRISVSSEKGEHGTRTDLSNRRAIPTRIHWGRCPRALGCPQTPMVYETVSRPSAPPTCPPGAEYAAREAERDHRQHSAQWLQRMSTPRRWRMKKRAWDVLRARSEEPLGHPRHPGSRSSSPRLGRVTQVTSWSVPPLESLLHHTVYKPDGHHFVMGRMVAVKRGGLQHASISMNNLAYAGSINWPALRWSGQPDVVFELTIASAQELMHFPGVRMIVVTGGRGQGGDELGQDLHRRRSRKPTWLWGM